VREKVTRVHGIRLPPPNPTPWLIRKVGRIGNPTYVCFCPSARLTGGRFRQSCIYKGPLSASLIRDDAPGSQPKSVGRDRSCCMGTGVGWVGIGDQQRACRGLSPGEDSLAARSWMNAALRAPQSRKAPIHPYTPAKAGAGDIARTLRLRMYPGGHELPRRARAPTAMAGARRRTRFLILCHCMSESCECQTGLCYR